MILSLLIRFLYVIVKMKNGKLISILTLIMILIYFLI